MLRLVWAIIAALFSGFRTRRGLMLENLALRQQLSTILQKRRPLIGPVDEWKSIAGATSGSVQLRLARLGDPT